jgi:hypothetical protein
MARRIEVELTSRKDDGSWTWRAAGAKQPRGVVGSDLLPSGAKAGDVLRVDAEFDLDGITIINVLPPQRARREPERIQLISPPEPPSRNYADEPAARGRREPRRDGRPDRGPRPGRPPRDGAPRERAPRDRQRERPERPERPARPRRERPAPPAPRPKAKKLRPGRTHRDAFLESLTPERRVVAEQLLKGGMPGVRTGLDESNAAAEAQGRPPVPTGPVLQMAEDLAPAARIAEWLDRAEAAVADLETLDLRDLRSVVVSAEDVSRDERTRELAARLREALERRSPIEQQEWLADVTASLEGGRVVRALRVASRPPTAGAALPGEVAERLASAASAALTAEAGNERWLTVLDAVAYSPVRRSVVPAGTPAEPDEPLLALVRKHAGRVPAVAERFGVAAPSPAPGRAGRRPPSGRPGGPPPPRAPRIPPPPTLRPPPPPAPAPTPAPGEAKPHGDELEHLAGTTSAEPPAPPTERPVPAPAEAKPHGDELEHLVDPSPAPETPAAHEPPAATTPAVERAEEPAPPSIEPEHAQPAPSPAEAKPHGDELEHLAATDAPPPTVEEAPPAPSPAEEAKPHGDELEHLADPEQPADS